MQRARYICIDIHAGWLAASDITTPRPRRARAWSSCVDSWGAWLLSRADRRDSSDAVQTGADDCRFETTRVRALASPRRISPPHVAAGPGRNVLPLPAADSLCSEALRPAVGCFPARIGRKSIDLEYIRYLARGDDSQSSAAREGAGPRTAIRFWRQIEGHARCPTAPPGPTISFSIRPPRMSWSVG